jgi:hypothetical protein
MARRVVATWALIGAIDTTSMAVNNSEVLVWGGFTAEMVLRELQGPDILMRESCNF